MRLRGCSVCRLTHSFLSFALQIGTGNTPAKGDFVGVHVRVTLAGAGPEEALTLLDTRAKGRPLAFVYLAARRAGGVLCPGFEAGIAGMRRGGTRVIDLPAQSGPYLGAAGPPLAPGAPPLPAGAAVRYEVSLEEVSPAYM